MSSGGPDGIWTHDLLRPGQESYQSSSSSYSYRNLDHGPINFIEKVKEFINLYLFDFDFFFIFVGVC